MITWPRPTFPDGNFFVSIISWKKSFLVKDSQLHHRKEVSSFPPWSYTRRHSMAVQTILIFSACGYWQKKDLCRFFVDAQNKLIFVYRYIVLSPSPVSYSFFPIFSIYSFSSSLLTSKDDIWLDFVPSRPSYLLTRPRGCGRKPGKKNEIW